MRARVLQGGMTSLLSGYKIGQAHDDRVKTGVTVILPDAPATASVDVRGGGPGTRETSALQDGGLIDQVHAIVLAGGSVYGLAAADAVTAWLGSQRIGYDTGRAGVPVSPIVPSAILFDNANGGCQAAGDKVEEGAVGAGYGATAGIYPGGLGVAAESVDGINIQAVIAANAATNLGISNRPPIIAIQIQAIRNSVSSSRQVNLRSLEP